MASSVEGSRPRAALAHLHAAMALLDKEGLQMAASRLAMAIDEVEDALADAMLKREASGSSE